MWKSLAPIALVLLPACAAIEYNGAYLNQNAIESVASGGGAASLSAKLGGVDSWQVTELFYAREAPSLDGQWNWVATATRGASGLPPGTYRLSFVEFGNHTSYAINENDSDLGSFFVGPGEVVYLGHFTFFPDGLSLRIVTEDRFEEVRAALPPELQGRIRKEILSLPANYQFQRRETYRF